MLPVAEEEMLSPLAPSSAWGEERVFSFVAGVGLAALETHQGANTTRAKKPHQGIFSKNRRLRFSAMWAKWSGTHQDRSGSWWKSVLGSALDANGNTLNDASGKSYTWDFENRLTQAVVPGTNGGTTSFKYDPFGRRIQKSGPFGTTNYLYDGVNSIEEVDQSGNILARYARTKKVDEPLSESRSGTLSYYQRDGVGSVTSLSNSSGVLANTYTYDSYGEVASSTGTLVNPFQYTGREFDSETGIYYYRARYFDPKAGRFLSEDQTRLRGGINFYAYTRNRPVLLTDPSGHQAGCPPQSPNCVPTDPDAPYQGSDGLWYNTLDWNGQLDPAPSVPDDGPTPPSPPPSSPSTCPKKKCDLVKTIAKTLTN
jgi:RHS repeat-associated protein